MGGFSRAFACTIIAVDLIAIVYFGAHFIVTGHVLPHPDTHTQERLAELVPVESVEGAKSAVKAKKEVPLLPASVERGQQVAGLCLSCHTFDQGGKNMTGPNLWGIYGQHAAHLDGYQYSQVFMDLKADGVTWDDENLDTFLKSPRKFASGTKMSFAGLRKEQQRIDLIAYLKTLK
tara:strand:- start:505 stop:1032 length:528 start_codon:yes stop_codon:yes gene_type:complete